MQIEEVAKQRRMTVIISPYFKSRKDGGTGGGTPNTVKEAIQCMKQLLALEKGVNLLIALQDGLGTGATAFKADRNPNYIATTEDYFRALKEVAGRKLYVVTECMTPGPTGIKPSVPTTRARVSQQLWTLRNFTQGSIGYKWNNHNGMDKIPGGVMTWRARYGNLN